MLKGNKYQLREIDDELHSTQHVSLTWVVGGNYCQVLVFLLALVLFVGVCLASGKVRNSSHITDSALQVLRIPACELSHLFAFSHIVKTNLKPSNFCHHECGQISYRAPSSSASRGGAIQHNFVDLFSMLFRLP